MVVYAVCFIVFFAATAVGIRTCRDQRLDRKMKATAAGGGVECTTMSSVEEHGGSKYLSLPVGGVDMDDDDQEGMWEMSPEELGC